MGQAAQIISPREVPLGGPRAMLVHRTLPSRERSLIGAWCFIDHYGPSMGPMVVPPHPHTGLQTVSWLFSGEIEHRDSVGSHEFVRPGELNLMTAGRGISHSEMSTPTSPALHGVQLWVALPSASRSMEPFFERHSSVVVTVADAVVRVFVGSLAGASVGVTTFTPLVAAEITLPAGGSVSLPVRADFEHGVLVDAGTVGVAGASVVFVAPTELAYVAPGVTSLTLTAGDADARMVLIGGTPLDEQILMWWNFVGRTHGEIVAYRDAWQREAGIVPPEVSPPTSAPVTARPDAVRFGASNHHYEGAPLPAPELPGVRLKPRAR